MDKILKSEVEKYKGREKKKETYMNGNRLYDILNE